MKKRILACLLSAMLLASVRLPAYAEEADRSIRTDLMLFRISYDEQGEMTVVSGSQDRVIAPGTRGANSLRIANPFAESAFCTVYAEAELKTAGAELYETLPFRVYLLDRAGQEQNLPIRQALAEYGRQEARTPSAGQDQEWTAEKAVLAGEIPRDGALTLTAGWEWPFESGNDAFDTMLGDMELVELTVRIRADLSAEDRQTPAPPSADPPGQPGSPAVVLGVTSVRQLMYIAGLVLSLSGLVLISRYSRRKRNTVPAGVRHAREGLSHDRAQLRYDPGERENCRTGREEEPT